MDGTEILGMSDDDFLKAGPPKVDKEADAALVVQPEVEQVADVVVPGSEGGTDEADAADGDDAGAVDNSGENQPADAPAAPSPAPQPPVDKSAGKDGAATLASAPAAPAPSSATPAAPAQAGAPVAQAPAQEPGAELPELKPEDYKAFYEKVMAPFKANGKTIQLKDAAEAIQLQQQGANFTRKMQDIAPHRKTLIMLENHGLLADPVKLSFAIDLVNKNPEAIKKLVKDAGINPLDIDTDAPTTYREGNHHTPGDDEVGFRTVLDDLGSNPAGKETLKVIHDSWDQASKDELWKTPQIMAAIDEQRASGVYDLITAEIDRQRTLGTLPAGTPFLQAYNTVGNQLVAAKGGTSTPAPAAAPATPVASRVAAPRPAVANSDKARAASTSRSSVGKVEKIVNPLEMSDEDFLALKHPRV